MLALNVYQCDLAMQTAERNEWERTKRTQDRKGHGSHLMVEVLCYKRTNKRHKMKQEMTQHVPLPNAFQSNRATVSLIMFEKNFITKKT